MPISKSVDLDKLAERTEGYVGADVESVCREAAILALRKDIKSKEVENSHFDEALKKVRASVTKEIIQAYEKLEQQFKQAHAKQMEQEKPIYYG